MLRGKIALVTGVTRGIGRAIVEVYAKNRAHIILHARDKEQVNIVADELTGKYGIDTDIVIFDLSSYEEIKRGFREIYKITKKLDILVNSAGVMNDALIGMVTQKQVDGTFAVNTFSAIYLSQYSSRLMSRHKSGSIINIGSIMGTNGNRGQVVYSGSKAAIIGITKSLAKELAGSNIRVNCITPGFIDTDMTNSLSENIYQEKIETIAMGRAGKAQEVADTALFLASDLSTYVTGQTIGVDGGILI